MPEREMRPIERLQRFLQYSKRFKYIHHNEGFQEAWKKVYPYADLKETIIKFHAEWTYYKDYSPKGNYSNLKETPLVCMTGDDGFLKYTYQCQECGTIIEVDNGEEECVTYDYLCPTCNHLTRSPFHIMKAGTMEWVNAIQYAKFSEEFNKKEGASYSVGNYTPLKFKPNRLQLFKFWFWVRYERWKQEKQYKKKTRKELKDINIKLKELFPAKKDRLQWMKETKLYNDQSVYDQMKKGWDLMWVRDAIDGVKR